jgi:hypothetical protein
MGDVDSGWWCSCQELRGRDRGSRTDRLLNAIWPPIVAAVRLPFHAGDGFLVVLAVDAGILLIISARDAMARLVLESAIAVMDGRELAAVV